MLRPVTSFEMKQKIPPFQKNKKTPESLDFQDMRSRIWVNFKSNRKMCRGETPTSRTSSENYTFSPDPKSSPAKTKDHPFKDGNQASLHTVYKNNIINIIVQTSGEVKIFLDFSQKAAGGCDEAVKTQISGFQT
jgi:hypothetical protein